MRWASRSPRRASMIEAACRRAAARSTMRWVTRERAPPSKTPASDPTVTRIVLAMSLGSLELPHGATYYESDDDCPQERLPCSIDVGDPRRGGSLSPPAYPGDNPCPTKGAAIQSHNDEDQRTLQRGTLVVRQERYGEAELR